MTHSISNLFFLDQQDPTPPIFFPKKKKASLFLSIFSKRICPSPLKNPNPLKVTLAPPLPLFGGFRKKETASFFNISSRYLGDRTQRQEKRSTPSAPIESQAPAKESGSTSSHSSLPTSSPTSETRNCDKTARQEKRTRP